jgi:chromosome segregation ATPase
MTTSEYQQLVDFLQGQFAQIDQRFTRVDERFTRIDQGFELSDRRFTTLDRRFDGVEQRLEAGVRDLLTHFDETYHRLDRLEQEYAALVQALRRIEGLQADERGQRDLLESSVAELKRHASLLQARIQALEARLRG